MITKLRRFGTNHQKKSLRECKWYFITIFSENLPLQFYQTLLIKVSHEPMIISLGGGSLSPKVSTTPITAMGCRQCLPLSVVLLKGKHCQKPYCCNGFVDMFGLRPLGYINILIVTTILP